VKLVNTLRLAFYPLILRIKLGEGGIALFNVVHAWFSTHSPVQTTLVAIFSIMTLCVLYGFNDYIDRNRDALNPKKNKQFVALINEFQKEFFLLNLFLSGLLMLGYFLFIGKIQAIYFLLLLVINAFYSLRFKSIPFLDLLTVITWGAAITLCVPVVSFDFCFLAGIMTGIAHVYQMLIDKETDRETHVNTAIARYPQSAFIQIFILCCILALSFVYHESNLWLFVSSMLPLVFYVIIKNYKLAWFMSRFYFAVVWLLLLYLKYGAV